MGRVKQYDEELRRRLVDEAGRLLTAEGIGAVTLRRVASLADTSTTAVYSLFGDKDGLVHAMYVEGFTRLGAALRRAARGEADPLAAVGAVGIAYRRAALRTPHLYGLMFAAPVPTFAPGEEASLIAAAAYEPLVEGVQACLEAGAMHGGEAGEIAQYLWGVAHGMVALELAGHLPGTARERAAVYERALVASVAAYLAPA